MKRVRSFGGVGLAFIHFTSYVLPLDRFHGVLAPNAGLRAVAQTRVRYRPRTLPAVWRRAQEHRRDRGTGGDCQDTHASGVACTCAAVLPGAAAGSLPGGLIRKTKAVWQHR